ncbi:ATP-dependent DNA helicase RecQ-like [Branchiostoma floridae]|uniref:DNA 3'-5' helicase n=1 Tax=Branchiostoma floridae TaxID=7739 RepID=A0A9J7HIR7_BRAFL|nr:ATP-dependent DNA helicase RecQ-like [Branchiostoma floridae]
MQANLMDRVCRVGKDVFDYDTLRQGQADAVLGILNGQDVFVGLPTGAGKTFCFQAIPSCLDSDEPFVIVISPLTALIDDQIARYTTTTGYKAIHLKSANDINTVADKSVKLVYTSPEVAVGEGRGIFTTTRPVCALVVDEAHCIPEWGPDFRVAFAQIGGLRAHCLNTPVMALTASASPNAVEGIKKDLLFREGNIHISGSLDRPNLFLVSKKKIAMQKDFLGLLQALRKDGRAIEKQLIYVPIRNQAMDVWKMLQAHAGDRFKASVAYFHSSMSPDLKAKVLKRFKDAEVRVVVATVAFGMGIDIPDISCVVVYGLPKSMSQLYQEIGRAGRSGEPATAVVFAGKCKEEEDAEDCLKQFVAKRSCIRAVMLKELGSQAADTDHCCSVCQEEATAPRGAYLLHPRVPKTAKRAAATRKKKRQEGDKKKLEKSLYELRNELFEDDMTIAHVGPAGVISDSAIISIKTQAQSIHTVEDLCKKVKGVSEDIAPFILDKIEQEFPEPIIKRRRRALGDLTNV